MQKNEDHDNPRRGLPIRCAYLHIAGQLIIVYSLLHSQVQDEYGLIVVPKHYIDNPKNDKEKLLKNAYEEYTAMLGWNDDMIAYRDSCIIRKARAIESSRRLLIWEKDTKTPPCSPKNESVVSVSSGQQEKLLQACKQVFKSCEDIRQRKGSDVADMNKNKGEAKTLKMRHVHCHGLGTASKDYWKSQNTDGTPDSEVSKR
jgi:hypothetical protein